ncbi:transport and Golgi organization protein 2 isoform X2 [Bombyx mandarina]|uniref:Transport and Golgi organization protein 2 isoform X2 n=1 Tax=Bombyx mandarina TaxID=7092 RepID=A0A6J2KGG8_BOMMA|nr:transport and Golgi organization protein 2 isoform X2 [Bombyx mandarina]
MCILFVYNGSYDADSDYSLIVATNRDEFYDRPSAELAPWKDNPNIIGGRGKIVAEFVKSKNEAASYVQEMKSYFEECNNFIFVAMDFGNTTPVINSFTNVTNSITTHTDPCLGFGNSLPDMPLKKVEAGLTKMHDICKGLNKISMKSKLLEELTALLKCNERHLPDAQLQERRPNLYEELSSIFVCVPEERYGTRAQTILLLTKTGHLEVHEISMKSPIDKIEPKWEKHKYQFDL